MPNHVCNLVEFEGDRDTIINVLEKIKIDEVGIGTIDFNKLIPQPSDLFQGSVGQEERAKYGNHTWYDWNPSNWGTKWNAYDISDRWDESFSKLWKDWTKEKLFIEFYTAWSAPFPILKALSKLMPTIEITTTWADEDCGRNCGKITWVNGEKIDTFLPENRTTAAYEIYEAVWGEDENIVYNPIEEQTVYLDWDYVAELLNEEYPMMIAPPVLFKAIREKDEEYYDEIHE